MKREMKPSARGVDPGGNHVGMLAWSLLAHPQFNMVGGIPGQPGPDGPGEIPEPTEPGSPTVPDEPPPAPVV
ncbi:hypothetical protein [Pseudomonas sp. DWP3-1-2]|uniref:hypothetical protein n=1 Tax=Pseudomonas sp. DWP3-1-2 TaxID=2804645 RepID=UPI003CF4F76A